MTGTETAAGPAAEREVVITRVIDAPARFLFLAWTRPEYVKRWFGPKGWPLTTCELDFRVGGKFRFGMTGPDGVAGPLFGGEYLEIVPNKKIVYDNGSDGSKRCGHSPRLHAVLAFRRDRDGSSARRLVDHRTAARPTCPRSRRRRRGRLTPRA